MGFERKYPPQTISEAMVDEFDVLLDPTKVTTEQEFESTWDRFLGKPLPIHNPDHTAKSLPRKSEDPPKRKTKVPRVRTVVQHSSAAISCKVQIRY